MEKITLILLLIASLFSSSLLFEDTTKIYSPESDETVQTDNRIYEMRTYTTHEGKLDALHQRFNNHTMQLFEKHGMVNVGYWTPLDPDLEKNTLIYIVSHESREAAEKSWAAFRADPEWQRAYEESHADGIIVKEVESVFMIDTHYSPMK